MPEIESEIFTGSVVVIRSKGGELQSIEVAYDRAVMFSMEKEGGNLSVRCDLKLLDIVLDSDFHTEAFIIWDTKLNYLVFINHLSGVWYRVPFQYGCWNMRIRDVIYHIVIGKNMFMVENMVELCNQPLN